MRWPEAVAPEPMTRVALVAPAAAVRDVLVRTAAAGTVEIDSGARPGEGQPGTAGALLRRAATGPARPLLAATAPDLDELAATGRTDLLAGEAQLEEYAATAVRRGSLAALAGWMPTAAVPDLAGRVADLGAGVVPLTTPPGSEPPTRLPHRSGAARSFAPLVTTYATVPYRDLDPTLLAGAAYVVMFGMMFGDVGHGALLLAAGLFLRSGRPRRWPRLHARWQLVAGAGLAACVFGLGYGEDEPVAVVAGRDVPLTEAWPIRRPRPCAERREADSALHTGQRVVDVLFPVARGSTAAVPGGFGTGKTVLLQQIAKWCDADVIVYVGCGERGNELADTVAELAALSDPRTGGRLLERTVVVANTSNMPMMAREASIYTGVTVAEYYRDMGYDAVVIADSTSRWAEALRELASRSGALPAEEGFPATLATALAGFYERAGRVVTLGGEPGSVTVIGAVSPAGGDLTEPITANTQRFVRTVWTLDRDLAYARHYPAVTWVGSFSRDADILGPWHARHGDPAWARRRGQVIGLLADADRLTALVELLGLGALPGPERMVLLGGRLLREGVLQQNALSPADAASGTAKSAALVDAVLDVVDRCQQLVGSGTPPEHLEEVDFGPLLRAREDVAGDDVDAIRRHRDETLDRLAARP